MRIGAVTELNPAAFYRTLYPLQEMERRGHEIVWPRDDGFPRWDELPSCDAVLVYRSHGPDLRRMLLRLRDAGVALVWDNDDDLRHLPRDRATRRRAGGFSNRAIFDETARTAKLAQVVTVTTEPIASAYRAAGVRDVRVIENLLPPETFRAPTPHAGLTVGWIAGLEHAVDARTMRLTEALRELQARHEHLHVTTIGVRLDLDLNDRYHHAAFVGFEHLPSVMSHFDIGIAPLLDTPFNRARSDIKVKEYAANQLAWLASPWGPYAHLGEEQGGRLVPDDGWLDALDALITDSAERHRLGLAAAKWATTQTTTARGDAYEHLFADAVERTTGTRPSMPKAMPAFDGSGRQRIVRVPQRLVRSAAR